MTSLALHLRRRWRTVFRYAITVCGVLLVVCLIAFLLYFPGRQGTLAVTLATGIGIEKLQAQVDRLEEMAINGEPFGGADKDFLVDLYTSFAKGGRLTIVLRQSAQLMDHYLEGSGTDIEIEPRVFLGSRRVQGQMEVVRKQIRSDLRKRGAVRDIYESPVFYMGDPEFFESYVALYFGRVVVNPSHMSDGSIALKWRAEMPWQWPSYESIYDKYGDYHAQSFPLPNAKSLLLGRRYCLRIDDGLGEHLARNGLAAPFQVYSQWDGAIDSPTGEEAAE